MRLKVRDYKLLERQYSFSYVTHCRMSLKNYLDVWFLCLNPTKKQERGHVTAMMVATLMIHSGKI